MSQNLTKKIKRGIHDGHSHWVFHNIIAHRAEISLIEPNGWMIRVKYFLDPCKILYAQIVVNKSGGQVKIIAENIPTDYGQDVLRIEPREQHPVENYDQGQKTKYGDGNLVTVADFHSGFLVLVANLY